VSVGEFVAGVDRLLTRGLGLFPVAGGSGGGVFAAGGGGGGGAVPAPPAGGSGVGSGAAVAGGVYEQTQAAVGGLDTDSGQTAGQADGVGAAGRAGSGVVRDSARAQAAAIAPMSSSAAGMRLMVSTMDERLAAMQRQLDTTTAQNRVLATRLRQVAEAYRGLGARGGGMPLSGLGGLPMLGGGGGGFGGGLSGLGSLAALPASLISGGLGRNSRGWGAAEPAATTAGAAGIAAGAIPLSEVSFEGKGVWPGGRGAVGHYLEEALDRMGITDPRARANWISGMTTIAEHESGFRADAINLSDSNAHGPRQADGGPLNSSRGAWQVVPGTFAKYHQPGTSNHIWDPVANACASMNYQMSRYGVAHDGHNARAMVGQANVGIHHGY
jgi:SLT domain-containing protein